MEMSGIEENLLLDEKCTTVAICNIQTLADDLNSIVKSSKMKDLEIAVLKKERDALISKISCSSSSEVETPELKFPLPFGETMGATFDRLCEKFDLSKLVCELIIEHKEHNARIIFAGNIIESSIFGKENFCDEHLRIITSLQTLTEKILKKYAYEHHSYISNIRAGPRFLNVYQSSQTQFFISATYAVPRNIDLVRTIDRNEHGTWCQYDGELFSVANFTKFLKEYDYDSSVIAKRGLKPEKGEEVVFDCNSTVLSCAPKSMKDHFVALVSYLGIKDFVVRCFSDLNATVVGYIAQASMTGRLEFKGVDCITLLVNDVKRLLALTHSFNMKCVDIHNYTDKFGISFLTGSTTIEVLCPNYSGDIRTMTPSYLKNNFHPNCRIAYDGHKFTNFEKDPSKTYDDSEVPLFYQ
jgi:hypothetical protein